MAKKVARRRREIPEDESKADRFVRVVTPRMNKAIKAIKQVGFCATSPYDYTAEQAERIISVLLVEVKQLAAKFDKKAAGEGGFGFGE